MIEANVASFGGLISLWRCICLLLIQSGHSYHPQTGANTSAWQNWDLNRQGGIVCLLI
jgi:hypothetical protein